MSWLKRNKIILAILFFALLLRLIGIDYGLPHFFVGDEQSQLGASLVMLRDLNLIPAAAPENFNLLYYPPVMSYFYLLPVVPVLLIWMLIAGLSPAELAREVALDPTLPWLAGRILIAVLGTLTVYLTYLLAARIFNKTTGLMAAVFLATSFLHVSLSHFTRHWVPTLFFATLAMLAAYNLWKYGRLKDYLWSAVLVALSFGVGFIGIVSGFFPILAHFSRSHWTEALKDKKFWMFLGSLLLLVAVIVVLYPQRFLEISQGTDISISGPKTVGGFFESFAFHVRSLALADPALFLLAILGALFGVLKKNRFILAFLGYSVLYISSLYFVIHNEPRYVSFLYAGFSILAAVPAALLFNRIRAGSGLVKAVSAVLLALFVIYPAVVSGQFVSLLQRDDTRISAGRWIENNIPENTNILSYFVPEVLTPTKQAIEFQKQLAPESLRTRDRVLLDLPEQEYPKSYNLLSWPKVGTSNGFVPEYAVLQYWNVKQYAAQPSELKTDPAPVLFRSGLDSGSVDFLGNYDSPTYLLFFMEQLGPAIEIHRLR